MFLYPPRPEKPIQPELIPVYEKMGTIAQIKRNGTCTVVDVDASGIPTFWTRHKELHKAWTAPPHIIAYFKKFPDSVIVAELLHNKHASVKDTLYIFDVLVYKGNDLVGSTLKERLDIIKKFPKGEGIWFAKTYTKNLLKLYEGLTDDIDEGIVLKNPNARLKFCFKDGLNAADQVKCRKSTKNYRH
jgi:hypothetical protein